MREILICTVGTSLISNIKNQKDPEFRRCYEHSNAKGLANALARLDASDQICGAEINSIGSILRAHYISRRRRLIFFVSDTEAGLFTGQVLTLFYESRTNPHHFDRVEYEVVKGLTDENVHSFRNIGLRNLVRLIGEAVRRYGSGSMLINATGGYKAQISFAGMIGQALEIPVCYMFERFTDVIQLPPQPVSLDLTFWLDNADVFFDLEEGIEKPLSALVADERFIALVDEVLIGEQYVTALSPTGQLFHETFRHHFEKQSDALVPQDAGIEPSRKKIRLEDKNRGKHKGLEVYLKKIANIRYVKEIYTHYYNPDLMDRKSFRKSSKGLKGQVEGVFSNNGATTKFDVITTAARKREEAACIADLNNLIAQGKL